MPEPSKPPPAPRSRRLWVLSLATMGLVLLCHVLGTILWRDRLPDPLAIHWSGSGVADGTGSIWTHLLVGAFTIVLLSVVMPFGARSLSAASSTSLRGNRAGEPLMAGLGNAMVVGIGGIFLSGLVGQLDVPRALGTKMDGPVLIGGLVLAVAWGVFSAYLVRAALPAAPGPEAGAPAPESPRTVAFAPGTVIASTVRGPSWMLGVLAGLLVLMAVLAVFSWREGPGAFWPLVPGIVILLGAGATCAAGKVVADEAGIRVYGGGFLRLLRVGPEDIANAEGREIAPAEFGGWGLRVSGAGVAFIVGTGPGVVVDRRRGAARIYSVATMDDARNMAALLNSLAARQRPAGSST